MAWFPYRCQRITLSAQGKGELTVKRSPCLKEKVQPSIRQNGCSLERASEGPVREVATALPARWHSACPPCLSPCSACRRNNSQGVAVMDFIDTLVPIVELSVVYFLLFTAGRPPASAERTKSVRGDSTPHGQQGPQASHLVSTSLSSPEAHGSEGKRACIS